MSDFYGYTWNPVGRFNNLALRRTIASVQVAYANEDVPPFNAGSGNGQLFFRCRIEPNSGDAPVNWPGDPDITGDIFFEPIMWNTGVYQPPNVTFGRPETLLYHGSTVPGVVDVQGQRVFEFDSNPQVHVFVGPLNDRLDSGPGTDQFTVSIMLRMLFGPPS